MLIRYLKIFCVSGSEIPYFQIYEIQNKNNMYLNDKIMFWEYFRYSLGM